MTPEEIKEARESLGLNKKQMAERLGVDRDTYYKWEAGKRSLPAIGATAIKLITGRGQHEA